MGTWRLAPACEFCSYTPGSSVPPLVELAQELLCRPAKGSILPSILPFSGLYPAHSAFYRHIYLSIYIRIHWISIHVSPIGSYPFHYISINYCLVVSTNPSEKWWTWSVGMILPNWVESHKIPWFQSPTSINKLYKAIGGWFPLITNHHSPYINHQPAHENLPD